MNTIVWMETYLKQAEQKIFDGRVQEGLAILTDLLYDEPGYVQLHNYLAWAYLYYANDAALAEIHLKAAMHFDSEYAPPYLHMGTLKSRAGQYGEAIRYFELGLTKPDANKSALLEGLAAAHEMTRAYSRAIRAYKQAATSTMLDFEVERMLSSAKRCRRKRFATMFSLW